MHFRSHGDDKTIDYVVCACQLILAEYGLCELFLIGSRARGNARKNSDYDFYAIVSDTAPFEIETGRQGHESVVRTIKKSMPPGLSSIDILSSKKANFEKMKGDIETIAHKCVTEGIRLFPKEE